MALVDHETLHLLKVQRSQSTDFYIFLTNLDESQFYGAILAGWLLGGYGLINHPLHQWVVTCVTTIHSDWVTYDSEGLEMSREEFIEKFETNYSHRIYEALTPW